MTLAAETVARLAEQLESAELEARDVVKITDAHPEMGWDDAYLVQDELLRRKRERGAVVVGLKAGLTSPAKMKQMGVAAPVFGFLVDGFAIPDGGEIDTRKLIHPKVEPEIAFVLGRPLRGPGCHIGAVLAATDCLLPGIEVIDSRYRDFKFDLKSVIADNTSAARFAVGKKRTPPAGLELRTLGVILEKNGVAVGLGAGAAVLGHPASSVAALANHLAARGAEIPAGAIVLTGGVTEAVAVQKGDSVTVRIQTLGSVSLRFV